MKVISLQSGSRGNCIYVETSETSLLFDAGISGKAAKARLAAFGKDIRDVSGLFISHDHSDHIKNAGVFSRKFGHKLLVSEKTYQSRSGGLGDVEILHHFHSGEKIQLGGICVETHPTPHDGVNPCAFVIEAEGKRLGILTDLGFAFPELSEIISGLDAVMLESNFDPYMLDNGPYPYSVRSRIKGDGGHISNQQAAALLMENANDNLSWACLSHISENNNTPQKALEAFQKAMQPSGKNISLFTASQREAACMPEV
ncbi:MBL fold metallo-hydrolase [Sedimentisphaera salicampi]|uniref:Metallo-hydrolase YycJ n=1 Tax=Sedimentisphaera salicampi TaxID=1941349 RepID=A0A1W6LLD3_9BACT|nr:MBL fold metallo-hydrolase [Sedimentisphaera salicampi]ARN56575.1 Putative metallo-hydrolase YycJ [Sedimentisphaera salicampi]OXU15467.1 putative metallo-hydrolase YycJ [Sedimentisphaera salicampi]